VPATVLSNDPEPIREFAAKHPRCIFKPVQGGAHTRVVTPQHLTDDNLCNLAFAPVTLQEEIAGAIAGVLREKLTGSAGQAAASFDAYAHYLAGVQHWNRRTPKDLDKALTELKLATDIDPEFAPAWGAIGLCYVTLHLYGLRAPGDVIPLARTAVDRALRLDRHQVGALTARACIRAVHDWDMEAAERDFREVIAAAPYWAI